MFNSTYAQARDLCVADRILVVKGRVDHKQAGETKLIAMELTPFEAVAERREVRFALDAREVPAGTLGELARLVREYPGECPVFVALETSEGPKTLALGPEYRVRLDSDFLVEDTGATRRRSRGVAAPTRLISTLGCVPTAWPDPGLTQVPCRGAPRAQTAS